MVHMDCRLCSSLIAEKSARNCSDELGLSRIVQSPPVHQRKAKVEELAHYRKAIGWATFKCGNHYFQPTDP